MLKDQLKLCLVTHVQSQPFSGYKEFILQAIAGGVTLIQLRDKSKSLAQIQQMAMELKALLAPYHVPLIINDHIDIAKAVDAEGVHIGQADVSPQTARELLGDKIIGLSVESLAELQIANELSCIDYIAASAVFPSKSKTNCKTIWGLKGLQKISAQSKHPIVAIGGIMQQNISEVIESGAHGVAVISALHDHANPRIAAQDLLYAIDQSLERKMYV